MSYGRQTTHSAGTLAVPDEHSGAQDLLGKSTDYHGFIRKRGKRERFFENFKFAKSIIPDLLLWRQRFAIVANGCIYIYSNENASKPLQLVHLEGYNLMYLMESEQSRWAFRLESIHSQAKVHYFSCVNDESRKKWMKMIRNGMYEANGQEVESPPTNDDYIYQYLLKPVFVQPEDTSNLPTEDDDAYNDGGGGGGGDSDDDDGSSDQSDYCVINDEDLPKVAPVKTKPNIPRPAIPPAIQEESDDTHGVKGQNGQLKKVKTSKGKGTPDYINAPDKKSKTLPAVQKPVGQKPVAAQRHSNPVAPKSKTQPQKNRIPSETEYMFNDSDRTKALQILKSKPKGTYLVRLSRNQDGKVLAVQTEDDVKEYRIFEKNKQVTLNNKDYYHSVEDLLSNYLDRNLPNRNISLTRAFSQTDVRF
ncbi:SH3 domain-binding protein 2-like isoform X2 [Gigantopelta aegis]|uniref:SH3 domain-binding protein 2-like isoform X2 n=1 Tax=Gigantopelta aegis TaxID=1735272 RepID=UPI001B88D050|nr:SH3 domain-binding protein 2-like isoform X2 [Gigantopelta aegis]